MNRPVLLSYWFELRISIGSWLTPFYGRHGAPDKVVADYEFEHDAPWRASEPAAPTPQVEHGEIGDGEAFAAELHAIVEEIEAERNGDRSPLPLTGDLTEAEREATVAAIQSKTTEVPVLDPLILLERDTQRWFDEAWHGIVEEFDDEFVGVIAALVDDEETRAKLLHLARCQRDEFAMTIEVPVIRDQVGAR